jgi:predicted flap endonuclease-1-like 5' DNA nuclease
MPLVAWISVAAALALGAGAGWSIRGNRHRSLAAADWLTRLAARDRELHDARQQTADLTVALHEAAARAAIEPSVDAGGRDGLLHRIEELEVELTALASLRCPDPGAHTGPGARPAGTSPRRDRHRAGTEREPNPDRAEPPTTVRRKETAPDDLTRISGIGTGLAKLLRGRGITSFEGLARLDEAMIVELDRLVGGIRERFARHDWRAAARALSEAREAPGS